MSYSVIGEMKGSYEYYFLCDIIATKVWKAKYDVQDDSRKNNMTAKPTDDFFSMFVLYASPFHGCVVCDEGDRYQNKIIVKHPIMRVMPKRATPEFHYIAEEGY